MNLTDAQDWSFPVPIAYGPGRLREIVRHCRRIGTLNPLVVTDRGSRDLPFIAALTDHLKDGNLRSRLYADISPNPRDDEIAAGRRLYRDGKHDGVIAIGGGSGMDGGKAIALVATNDLDLWSFEYSQTPPEMSAQAPFPPLICIPSTAGTGAETESTAMITQVDRGMKLCVWHAGLKPSLALLDPEITLGLPADITAWTGLDAMVHAIEAYCVPVFHPLCDGIALEGLRLVNTWLVEAVHEPDNIEARGGMLVGSCLAGVSFLKGLGMVHAISHMIGAAYDSHHGLTNAIVLPAVLRFNAPAIENRVTAMAEALELKDHSFDAFYRAICARLDRLQIPRSLSEIGVAADCALAIAAKAIQDSAAATNPRQASLAEFQAVIEEALLQGR